jgi:nucleoside-diphosphate-sugar epimerase
MRILITGNLGYVGSVLVRHLRAALPAAELVGYDSGFFAHCLTGATELPETALDRQHFGDVRDLPPGLLADVDAVVHLAAVSNDPMVHGHSSSPRPVPYMDSRRAGRDANPTR